MSAIRFLAWTTLVLVMLSLAGIASWVYLASTIEMPNYTVVEENGAIEVRDYPAMVVAEVVKDGNRQSAVSAGFRTLAAYIFAKERDDGVSGSSAGQDDAEAGRQRIATTRIAMTAPVMQERVLAGDNDGAVATAWTVRFVMPAKYALGELPKPAEESGVQLKEIPAGRRVAIRFSGVPDDDLMALADRRLKEWLSIKGLTPDGPPMFAYYNDPFTPGSLRRNEVIYDLK